MKKAVITIFILGTFLLTSCGSSVSNAPQAIGTLESVPVEYAGKTNPLDANAVTDGTNIFHTNCEACHGTQGHGDGPAGAALDPRPTNLAELQAVASDDYLLWRISEGKYGTSMVGWKSILTEEQIWLVIAFIRTLK
jgi:mono/diheme cytochrome c family protein